jgi:hypothetical protein
MHTVTGPVDIDDDRMVHHAIDHGGRDHWIAQVLAQALKSTLVVKMVVFLQYRPSMTLNNSEALRLDSCSGRLCDIANYGTILKKTYLSI